MAAGVPRRSEPLQYPHHTQTGQRRVRLDPQGLSRVAIHQVQRSEFPPAGHLVMGVVHRPHLICTCRKRQRHPRLRSKFLAPPTLHRQPFLLVQPIHSLVVDATEMFRPRSSPVAGKCTAAGNRIAVARQLTRAAEPVAPSFRSFRRYRQLPRCIPISPQARRSLSPASSHTTRTASRFACGPTTFLIPP